MFTKQNGIKLLLIIILLLVIFACVFVSIVVLLTGSSGLGDWAYEELPNNYEVWRINSQDIVVGKASDNDSFEVKIDRFVLEFSYNDRFIGVKQFPLEQDYDIAIDVKEFDTSDLDYYIIDSITDTVYGPYSYYEYENKCDELKVGTMREWMKTDKKTGDG